MRTNHPCLNGLTCFVVHLSFFYQSVRLKLALPQSAQLSIFHIGKKCCTFVRELINEAQLIGYRSEEKSPAPCRTRIHDLYVKGHVIYLCATTAALVLPLIITLSKTMTGIYTMLLSLSLSDIGIRTYACILLEQICDWSGSIFSGMHGDHNDGDSC